MLIFGLGLLSSACLLFFLYRSNKGGKQPFKLLRKVFLFGALSLVPAAACSIVLTRVISIFLPETSILHVFLEYFIIVGFVEEFGKRWAAKKAWNAPAFHSRFDAIQYCITASIGFAAGEYLVYALGADLLAAAVRAVVSISNHGVYGLVMGIFFAEAKAREVQGDEAGTKRYWRLSLIMPALVHGFFDFWRRAGWNTYVFILMLVVVYTCSIKYIKRVSAQSATDDSLAVAE